MWRIRLVTAAGFLADRLADLLLEAAALLLVFVPLELWDKRTDHAKLIIEMLYLTLAAFSGGITFRLLGRAAYRVKDDLEGKGGSKASPRSSKPRAHRNRAGAGISGGMGGVQRADPDQEGGTTS